jgi:hypothetical protein
MTLADVFATVVVLAIAGVGFPSLVLLVTLLFPTRVTRAAEHAAARPGWVLGVGALALVTLLIFMSIVSNTLAGPGKLLSLLGVIASLAVSSIGFSGLSRRVARQMKTEPPDSASHSELFAAAALVELACALPLVGWLVVLPLVLLTSFGAGVLAVAGRTRNAVAVAPSPAEVETHA